MTDKLAKSEIEECMAFVVDSTELARDMNKLAHAQRYQPAVVEQVRELVPYDYIWNEQTRNFEPVFVPGNEQDIHMRENAAAQAKLLELREKRLAEREARVLAAENARVRELGKG